MKLTVSQAIKILELEDKPINPEATKAQYRRLSAKYHPDRNPNGLERMKQINVAYDVLRETTISNDNKHSGNKSSPPKSDYEHWQDIMNSYCTQWNEDLVKSHPDYGIDRESLNREKLIRFLTQHEIEHFFDINSVYGIWIKNGRFAYKFEFERYHCRYDNKLNMWRYHPAYFTEDIKKKFQGMI